MPAAYPPPDRARFGDFELDFGTGELRRNGVRIPLPEQPLRLLEALVERPGLVVSRDQLRERLWASDTFVDFEHGLNAAVKRLRDALGDSAEQPRFVETVPKRGYRFVAPVDAVAFASPTPLQVSPSSWWRPLVGLVAIVAVVATIAAAWWVRTRPPSSAPGHDLPSRLRRVTFDPGLQTDPTFSPDGRSIAYAANTAGNFDIWIQPLDGGPAEQLTRDPANDTQPDWSPDGRFILFRSEREGGGLFVVSPTDKHVERRTRDGYGPRWSPDGTAFAFGSNRFFSSTSYVARADGSGTRRVETKTWLDQINRAMGWDPRGRLVFLYGEGPHVTVRMLEPGATQLSSAEIDEGVRQRFAADSIFVTDNQPLAWSTDGRALYFVARVKSASDIWRISVDPDSLRVIGGPVRVTTGSESELTLAAARAGQGLAFSASTRTTGIRMFTLDATGRATLGAPQQVTPAELNASEPTLSPDGRRLVVRIEYPAGNHNPELRELSLDTGMYRTLRSIDPAREDIRVPRWSRDGAHLVYGYREFKTTSFRTAIKQLDVRSLQESFVTSLWTDGTPNVEIPGGWSADSRSILSNFWRYRKGHAAVARLPLTAAPTAERAAQVLVSSTENWLWQADESPDGRWVCYQQMPKLEGRYSALFVVPAAGGAARELTDNTSWDDKPRWSSDGRLIYFLSTRSGSLDVWAVGFDASHGRPTGPPFQVKGSPGFGATIAGIDEAELTIAGARAAVPVQNLNGGIWILQ